ncbi:MAG: ABC transporter permease [Deltaproteobacteria bacterium]|nr:ABC transporter permease [Deltaproteobacteria bacterium]
MTRVIRIIKESFRMVRNNRLRGFIMILGIAIGVTSLAMTVCVSVGVYENVMETVNKQGPDLIQVRPGTDKFNSPAAGSREAVSLRDEDYEAILQHIGNIDSISPVKDRKEIEVKYEDKNTHTRIFGVNPIWGRVRDFNAIRGSFITDEDVASAARVCVIGQIVKKNLFGDADPIGQTIQIMDVPFTVKGELESKGTSSEGRDRDDRIITPFTTYNMRVFRDSPLSQIVIKVKDIDKLYKTVEDVQAVLREQHKIETGEPDDFTMRTPQDLIDMAYGTSRSLIKVLTIIAVITLLVAGIVIMNIMLTSVSARKSEIGIRRALGARKNDILNQFMIECIILSLMGGILGTILGYCGAIILSNLDVSASNLTPLALAAAIVSCCLIAVVFGIYPARKAANQNPVDILRG